MSEATPSKRDPVAQPMPGDTFENTFPYRMFEGISDELVTMCWTVRVITTAEEGFVGVKLYGVGRMFWTIESFRERANGATWLHLGDNR